MREAELTPEDEHFLSLLEARRDKHFTRSPLLSNFRVLALFSYEALDGQTADKFVVGANAECANIGGATCAERAAMAQLQLLPVKRVRAIYIVSDSPQCLTPGTLCREFLLSSPLVTAETPFVSRAKNCRPCVTTLKELYPFPSLYDRLPRAQVLPFARAFCSQFAAIAESKLQPQEGEEAVTPFVKTQLSRMTPDEQDVYLKALDATEKDARDDLFPLRYAAGTKFSDGDVRVTWQHKTLEYGSSLDAISKLIPFVEDKQQHNKQVKPEFLMQVDQFGILHAPFARARAYFFEFGFLDVPVLVHDAAGELHRVPIGTLVAESPDCIAASTALMQ
ncbi:Phosphatidylinositol class b [Phytophthora cinnamomi]|uniref:Phosphatidylinositol class b n=1 Tax=Phytophthora cinnamomi TaxID=4785 RepID=UPI003559CDB2|nr:Phosphatidylinositol class b [Phytophthora cinnamomi]